MSAPLQYNVDDDIFVFFCFPTLGVAIPLRPGDYLMFNSVIPHCVSSTCSNNDNVVLLSTYIFYYNDPKIPTPVVFWQDYDVHVVVTSIVWNHT